MSVTATWPGTIIFDLPDYTFIGGSNQNLIFYVNDANGNPVNISTAQSITWKMANWGSGSSILTKSGSYISSGSSHNSFIVNLLPADTLSLSTDKFWHEYTIVDFSGSSICPSAGVINIIRAIQ